MIANLQTPKHDNIYKSKEVIFEYEEVLYVESKKILNANKSLQICRNVNRLQLVSTFDLNFLYCLTSLYLFFWKKKKLNLYEINTSDKKLPIFYVCGQN